MKDDFYNKLLPNIKYVYIFSLAFFILLDYKSFTDFLHLSNASFLENYIYTLDIISAGFVGIFILFPLVFSVGTLLLFYILYTIIKEEFGNNLKNFSLHNYIFHFILFISVLSLLILILNCESIANLNIFLLFFFFLPFSIYLSSWVLKLIGKHNVEFFKSKFLFILFLIVVIIITIILRTFYTKTYIQLLLLMTSILIIIICLFFVFISFQVSPEEKKSLKIIFPILSIIGMIFINSWLESIFFQNNVRTFNLLINPTYKKENHYEKTIDISAYKCNPEDKKCKKCKPESGKLILTTDGNTSYLPLFKNAKIYYKNIEIEIKDTNKTTKIESCVYLMHQEEGESPRLEEIGYIYSEQPTKKSQ